MERYTSLYRLPKNQYTAGCPVLLAAGTLLKDSQMGAVLAQLKMQSLSAKRIQAVMVAVDASDVSGAPLGGVAEYQYLDLSVRRDEAFGQHQAIVLPDANTRCIAVRCTRVVFVDGTSWEAAPDAMWSPLPEPEALEKALPTELVRQYCRDTAACAAFQCAKFGDLWRCTCGALNGAGEKVCHACGLTLDAQLAALDKTALREHLAAYEKAEAEKEETRRAKNQKIRKKALAIGIPAAAVCAAAILIITVLVPKLKLNKAMRMIDAGEYDSAYAMLEELGNTEAIAENKHDRAMDAIDTGDYDFAYAILEELGKTEEIAVNKYDRAMECIAAQDYEAALALLDGLNYKDSGERRESTKSDYYRELFADANVGDTIFFGSYEQDNDTSNGKESIEWLVLARKDDRLLVISQYALDSMRYNLSYMDVTWESCTLREWLNEYFFNAAFSNGERSMIPTVVVRADKNPDYDTDPGNATRDKVFLLSITEATRYFKSDEARMCVLTAYAKRSMHSDYDDAAATCWWWLRSPGSSQNSAALVRYDGAVNGLVGFPVFFDYRCVRPAMWISLED